MTKLLIVEDNQIVKEGLCEGIDWEANGIRLLEPADNGVEALERMEAELPDVVVTDVIMPLMDGIRLSQTIQSTYPSVKIIVMSAHDEFEFAQQALKAGVIDYITKPIQYDCLLDSVRNAMIEKNREEKLLEQVLQGIPLLREKFLLRLAEGEFSSGLPVETAEFVQINFSSDQYACIVYEIDHAKEVKQRLGYESYQVVQMKLAELIDAALEPYTCWRFGARDDLLALLVCYDDPGGSGFAKRLQEGMEAAKNLAEARLAVSLSAGIGSPVFRPEAIHESFRSACEALETKFILGYGHIINASDLVAAGSPQADNCSEVLLTLEERLVKQIKLGQKNEATACVWEIRDQLRGRKVGREYVQSTLLGIIFRVFRTMSEIEGLSIVEQPSGLLPVLLNLSTEEDWFSHVEHYVRKQALAIEESRSSGYHHIVSKAIQYIEEFYTRSELDLQAIANAVNLSPSYFSTIFKRETKTNVIDYITKMRIEKAQELLIQTNEMVYEIGYRVGFDNPHYFSACFKTKTGQSPNEFRRSKGESAKRLS